jgi:hypothetical protein
MRRRFNISHSVIAIVILLIGEAIFASVIPSIASWLILLASLLGGGAIVVIATDVVEEVRNSKRMLILLSATVVEFIIFFAFQYHFILHIDPTSFKDLLQEPVSLLLQSTMTFALNPLYLPETVTAKALLLINTIESLVLALFVLQNIWQLHRK